MELWRRRVLTRIRGLPIAIYRAIGWLGFGAVLVASNWATIRLAATLHPIAGLVLMVLIVIMLEVIWFGAMWILRRYVAELEKVTRLTEEIEAMSD